MGRKQKHSWHQRKMRFASIVIVVLLMLLFAGLFYWFNRQQTAALGL
jgi:multisubunit Na+/H+ antiporter MnhB subunit